MGKKNVQANMQIDVSFVANTKNLVKELEKSTSSLKLDSGLTKGFGTSLNKSFKEVYTNLDKMSQRLNKPGLNSKEYTNIFKTLNSQIQDGLENITSLQSQLTNIFKGSDNTKAIKQLKAYKEQLEQLEKLRKEQNTSKRYKKNATEKFEAETGLSYNAKNKNMLLDLQQRKTNKQKLTPTQENFLQASGIDNKTLKNVIMHLQQIEQHQNNIIAKNAEAAALTGDNTVDNAIITTTKMIDELNLQVYSAENFEKDKQQFEVIEQQTQQTINAADSMGDQFEEALIKGQREAEEFAKTQTTLNEILSQFGIILSASAFASYFKQLLTDAYDFYKSLDSALNEIYVVSNLSSEAVNGLKTDFIKMAKETGMALDDVTRSAVLFYQQGLNTAEVMEMTRVTSEFAKVAGIDAVDAADKLTAAINGYCLSAEDASLVADKFNKVAAVSAADIDELSTAFSKAAAQANQAGIGMDNYLAYIATMVEATREAPENIGTSLKTIMSRMQQVKTSGTTEDGDTDVNKVETALESVGIALRDANGELRDLEEVFAELGPKWNSLDRNTQAYLGTIIAGTRQQSRFITLMQNWDRVLELSTESQESAGQQALMHAKAMDSVESKAEQLSVTWQEFISNITSSDTIKDTLTVLTRLLNLISTGQKPVALLSTAFALLGGQLKKVQDFAWNKITHRKEKEKINGTQIALQKNQEAQGMVNTEIQQLTASMQNTQNLKEKIVLEEQIKKLKEQQTKLTEKESELIKQQNKQRKELMAQKVTTAGMAISGAGLAISQFDDNAGSLVSGTGTGVMAIGQALSGNYLGAIISGVTAFKQITSTLENWEENLEKRLTESAIKLNEAVEKVSQQMTQTTNLENLKSTYTSLSQQAYLTTTEQEKLNSTIQEMADTYNIETTADAYGNLRINISEVNSVLDDLNSKLETSKRELDEIETQTLTEALSGIGNTNNVKDFYNEFLNNYKGTLKTLINDLDKDLIESSDNVTANMFNNLNSNLKTAIMTNVENNVLAYTGDVTDVVGEISDNINNALKKGNNWDRISTLINRLQQQGDNLTFSNAQVELDNFFNKFRDELGLTTEEWKILVDAINGTVFDNSPLLDFYAKVQDEQDSWTGEKFDSQLAGLEQKIREKVVDYENTAKHNPISAFVGVKYNGEEISVNNADELMEYVKKGATTQYGNWGPSLFRFKEGDTKAKELDSLVESYNLLLKERNGFIMNYAKEHGVEGTDGFINPLEITKIYAEAEKLLNARIEMAKILQSTSATTAEYMGTVATLYETENLGAEATERYANSFGELQAGLETLDNNQSRANFIVEYANNAIAELGDSDADKELKEQWEKIRDEAFSDLTLPRAWSFTDLGKEIDNISSDLRTLNSITEEFDENAGISLDTFMDLAAVLDNINMDALASYDLTHNTNTVQQFANAIDNLKLRFDAANGMITANGEALQSLQAIQQMQVQAELTNIQNSLRAKKAEAETQEAYIQAQIDGTAAAIEAIKSKGGADIAASEISEAANKATTSSFDTAVQALTEGYGADIYNQAQWSKTVLGNLSTVAEAWGKYYQAVADGNGDALLSLRAEAERITSENNDWEYSDSLANFDKDKNDIFNQEEQTALLGQLESNLANLQKQKEIVSALVGQYDSRIDFIESMKGADLSKFTGDEPSKGGGSDDVYESMVEKLEHFYNYLRQIEALEEKINKIREKRNLIDATQNYYIKDLAEENELLKEQASLYGRYIDDEIDYLATLRQALLTTYGEWVYFNDEGVIQVKQTEFAINSEEEEKRYEAFSELLEEYQNEYNTMLENQNLLYNIQATIVENISEAYDKVLQKITDIGERLEYLNSISEHKVEMSFGSIEKLGLLSDQIKTTTDMLLNAQKGVNELEGDFNDLNEIIEKSAFKSLLTWDETLNKYLVNNDAMEDSAIRKQFEEQGYSWQDIVTWVNAVAAASQKIVDSTEEVNEQLMSAREALKDLLEERISTIDEIFEKATDELNKFYGIYEDKIAALGTENDLFGVDSSNLEQQFQYLETVAQHSKAVLAELKENNQLILETLMKDYAQYVEMVDGVAYINKMAIEESGTLTEGQKADLLQLYQLYYDSNEQIEEMNDKFYDYIEQIKEMEEAKRDAIIDLKDQLYEELIALDEKEIEDLQEKYDKMSALDNEYYSQLQQKIADARDARSRLQDQQNLTQMQNRLSVLQQDNSGKYNAEIVSLQEQINQSLQAQADQAINLEMERIAREQQQREEDRQMQITQMENLLTFKDENGIYWQDVLNIIANGPASIIGILTSSEDYRKLSDQAQEKQFEKLNDTIKTANTTLGNDIGFESTNLRQDIKDFVSEPISEIPSSIISNATAITDAVQTGTEKFLATMLTLFKYLNELTGKTEAGGYNTGIIDENGIYQMPTLKPVEPPPPPVVSTPVDTGDSVGQVAVGSRVNAGSARIYSSYNGGSGYGQYYANDPIYTVLKILGNRALVRYHKLSSGYTGWFNLSDLKAYSQGGYVDYTGLAAVHGKAGKPEAFLNAKQTQLFEALKNSLATVSSINTREKSVGDNITIENLTIDVKELADTDSIDKVVKTVKDSIYKDATSGNNMKINRRR